MKRRVAPPEDGTDNTFSAGELEKVAKCFVKERESIRAHNSNKKNKKNQRPQLSLHSYYKSSVSKEIPFAVFERKVAEVEAHNTHFRSWMIAVVSLLVAILFGTFIVYIYQKHTEQLSWPHVEGKILRSTTVTSGKKGRKLVIGYEFEVNNTMYHGDSVVWFATPSVGSTLAKYPEGRIVDVFYDPSYPEHCLLEPGITWHYWLYLLFFGAAVCLFAAAIAEIVNVRRKMSSMVA